MRPVPLAAVVAGLLTAAACAGPPPPAGAAPAVEESREPGRGASPTEPGIERALLKDVYEMDRARCPLRLLRCGPSTADAQPGSLRVDQLRCAAVGSSRHRCTFRLTETVRGQGPARSRSARSVCRGRFWYFENAHLESRWAVDQDPDDMEDRLLLSCRRTR